ncbi:hypothetical protein SAMN03159423_0472 [Bradyrhizobium sp. NFR13]|nr:hypothetical protein SAMN03159423_0472 [Bradyrhizobium sp. NFR13]
MPILGFLLRSTNTRNSFEAYYAFSEIANSLIGSDAKVIFSSEWDFSPITYPMSFPALPSYVLLGMPSLESANALVLPLAGHELGHSVWLNEDLESRFAPDVDEGAKRFIKANWAHFIEAFDEHKDRQPTDEELADNMFIKLTISDISQLALYQIEEIFCDAVGSHLFGQSYALAFHYLLAPSLGFDRALEYPTLQNRAEFIAKFGGINLADHGLSNFSNEFEDRWPPMTKRQQFHSSAADTIGIALAEKMFGCALDIVSRKAASFAALPSAQPGIVRKFENSVPAREPRSLPDIVNAGWTYLQSQKSGIQETDRGRIEWISELVLKSIEVLEFRNRTANA